MRATRASQARKCGAIGRASTSGRVQPARNDAPASRALSRRCWANPHQGIFHILVLRRRRLVLVAIGHLCMYVQTVRSDPAQVAESGAVDCASPAVERAAGRSRAHRSGRARRVQTRAAREICPEGFCFQSLLDTIRRRPPSCPPWPNRAGLSYCYLLVRTLPCSTLPLLRPSSSRHPKKRMRNYQFSNRKCRLKRGLPLQKGGGLLDDNRFPEILLAPPRSPTGGHLVRGCVEKQLADNVCFAFSDLTSFDHQPSAQRPC